MTSRSKTLQSLQSVKGFGKKLSERLWKKYGKNTVDVLLSDPESVASDVSGVSSRLAKLAQETLKQLRELPLDEAREELRDRWDELFERRIAAEEVFVANHDSLLDHPHVTGIHVGLRRREGRIVRPLTFCIRVHVRKKYPENHPRLQGLLPQAIDGIEVDVLEREYVAIAAATPPESRFIDPIEGGIPIAPVLAEDNFGTLGGIVFSGLKRRYITNEHVVGRKGQKVQQPPNGDVPSGKSKTIGEVIDSQRKDGIDCAIVKPTGRRRKKSEIISLPDESRYSAGVLTLVDVHQTECFKVGAVTGTTKGVVKSVDTTVVVDAITQRRQIVVESPDGSPIIDRGDSGSLLFVQAPGDANYHVVGLVHAASTDFKALIATHFADIANRFGVKVSFTDSNS